jgi:acyl-CoA dehydrogenase
VDFTIPDDIQEILRQLDQFIEDEIKPLEQQDDNIRFFDHRREYARTDYENGGVPRKDWEELLAEMRRRADRAGFLKFAVPERYGGKGGSNLAMAVIREHLAAKGLGLHNDLQNESSIVGNFATIRMWEQYGSEAQKKQFLDGMFTGGTRVAFGLTEPDHGSDATWLETRAIRDGDDWVINGQKRFNSGMHNATHDMIFARTSGEEGKPRASAALSCRPRPKASRLISCGGHSTCPPTMRKSR